MVNSTTTTYTPRPNIDIEHDVRGMILRYPPTAADHRHIKLLVIEGVVYLRGHVRTSINRRWLLEHVPQVSGVREVNADQLYDEDSIRVEAGQRLADYYGVIVNAQHDTLVLAGKLPEGVSVDDVLAQLAGIDGVERVILNFA